MNERKNLWQIFRDQNYEQYLSLQVHKISDKLNIKKKELRIYIIIFFKKRSFSFLWFLTKKLCDLWKNIANLRNLEHSKRKMCLHKFNLSLKKEISSYFTMDFLLNDWITLFHHRSIITNFNAEFAVRKWYKIEYECPGSAQSIFTISGEVIPFDQTRAKMHFLGGSDPTRAGKEAARNCRG